MYKPVLHDDMRKEWEKDPEFLKEKEIVAPEFELLREMMKARKKAKLTQTDVASRMGTKPSVVSRLESVGDKRSPSVRTLRSYAEALGCRLKIQFLPV